MLPGYAWMNLIINYIPVARLAEGKIRASRRVKIYRDFSRLAEFSHKFPRLNVKILLNCEFYRIL
jgi:hypothetical protein